MVDPNNSDIYAGIAGIDLPTDTFDFGDGIFIRKTYAHVMAPYVAAFARTDPGKPHPAPWKSVGGGFAFDIEAELHIPKAFHRKKWFDRLNTVWWFLALLRFRVNSLVTVPVIANAPFAIIPELDDEPSFWPIEMDAHRIIPDANSTKKANLSDLDWIKTHWLPAGSIMNENDDFNFAFQALDSSIFSRNSSIAVVLLWGALERLFSPSHQELTFRASITIASYLEPPGEARLNLYKTVRRLYGERSKSAHGSTNENLQAYVGTYALLKRALEKMIEQKEVPNREYLESLVFGLDYPNQLPAS